MNFKFKFFLDSIFSEPEDYIITNMKKTEFYKQLVESKGQERTDEREKFLKQS